MNPHVISGLGVNMLCQCRFIYYNKCITLVGNIDNGGDFVYVRGEGL